MTRTRITDKPDAAMGAARRYWEQSRCSGFYLREEEEQDLADIIRRHAAEQLAERDRRIAELEGRIERLGTGIHSCHQDCQRPMCVMRRKIDALRELVRAKNEALDTIARIHWGWDGDCGAVEVAVKARDLGSEEFEESEGGAR